MKKYIFSLLMIFGITVNGFCADQWTKTEPAGTRNASDIDAYISANNEALDRLNYDHRQGVVISYSSTAELTLGAGTIAIPNAAGTTVRWRRNSTSTTVDWGDIDTGVEAVSQTYYVYAIADTDATTFTFLISTNSSAPTGATYYRRLGSFYNNSSGNIENITNDTNYFINTYDSGWFAVALNTSYTKTHSLGTNKLFIQVWYSASSDGSDAELVYMNFNSGSVSYSAGCWVNTLTTTTIKVNTGASDLTSRGYTAIVWGGTATSVATTGYYRIIALAF